MGVGKNKVYKIRRADGKYAIRKYSWAEDEGSIFTTLNVAKGKLTSLQRYDYDGKWNDAVIEEYVLVTPEALAQLESVWNFNQLRYSGTVPPPSNG